MHETNLLEAHTIIPHLHPSLLPINKLRLVRGGNNYEFYSMSVKLVREKLTLIKGTSDLVVHTDYWVVI